MRGFISEGIMLPFTAPAGGVTSGVPVLIGGLLVVPAVDAAVGETFDGRATGVFKYTKVASQAWTEGQKIYWDTRAVGSGGQRFTTDGTQGPLVGVAVVAVGSGAGETTGRVRFNGAASSLLEGVQTAITALTDNSGGAVADGTIGVVTNPTFGWNGSAAATAAEGTAINTAITAIKAAITELATKQNAVIAALQAAGILL